MGILIYKTVRVECFCIIIFKKTKKIVAVKDWMTFPFYKVTSQYILGFAFVVAIFNYLNVEEGINAYKLYIQKIFSTNISTHLPHQIIICPTSSLWKTFKQENGTCLLKPCDHS